MLNRLMNNRYLATSIALVCGLLVPLSFAPHNLPFIELLSLSGMLLLVRSFGQRFAIFLWFVFGLGMFGYGVWWIQVSVHQFGLPLYSFSVTVTAAFIIAQACQIAIFGWFANNMLNTESTLGTLIGIPASWVAIEIFRSWFGSGFPWLLLGYAHVESPLAGFAPIGGVHLVSFCIVFIASSLYLVLHRQQSMYLLPAALVITVAYGLDKISWTKNITPVERSVALVQGAVPQEIKWHPEVRQPSIDLYNSLSEPYWDRDLIIWPETAIPAFSDEVATAIDELSKRAIASDTVFLVGMPNRSGPNDDGTRTSYFNSLLLLGRASGRYDKRHLVPFGEFMPFDSILRPLTDMLNVPMSDFSKGKSNNAILKSGDIAIGSSICYEDAYSGLLRDALPDANVLVNISNDAWFGDTIAPHQHLQISQMRALELGRYMLRATNTGISAIINERGRVVSRSEQFEAQAIVGSFYLFQGYTPYARVGSLPILLFSTLGVIALKIRARRG